MSLKKLCPKCNKIINYTEKYCEKCKDKYGNKGRRIYNKEYDIKRRKDKHYKFYKTREWVILRDYVLRYYRYIDIYEYYINNRLINADTAHHIIEIKDDWNKRLQFSNLFPCSCRTHNLIHQLYSENKQEIQQLLRDLLRRWEGTPSRGIKKVLS